MQSTTFSPSKNHAQNVIFRKTPSKNHEFHAKKKLRTGNPRTPRLG
jgi:hypothetical protein